MSAREKATGTKDSVSLLPCFYFVELPILVSSVVSLYFLEWTDVFKPVKSGFTCHDRSLSLPFVEPTHEVVPLLMLLSLAFAGPAITIMLGEGFLFCCFSRKKSGAGGEANINAAGCNFNSFIRRVVRFVGVLAFGLCATALITDVLQLMTGYPAPYFLTVCKPNYTALSVSCEQNPFVMADICSGTNMAAILQGRKSFPSQHATLASFAAVYVSMYFNSTLTDSSKLLKPLLVFSFIMCGIICGLTRIIQYKNHAIDVYLGFLLGGAIAVYLGLFAVGNFQPSEEAGGPRPGPPVQLAPRPPCSLPHISQEAVLHHLQMKASLAAEAGLPTSHSEGLLHRSLQQQQRLAEAGRGAEGDLVSSCGPLDRGAYMTFSQTLPRVHTPQAIAAYEEAARRHAATLHHASLDSSRSKQLLSQWKSRKVTLQVPGDPCSPGGGGAPPPHHHGSMELPSGAALGGPNGGFDGGSSLHQYMAKLAPGASTTLPGNCSGITGGARVAMQARPGSSQLVHIPEEALENYHHSSPRSGEDPAAAHSAAHANWQMAAEACRTSANGPGGPPPRIMQVIAMSKQQGLLQTHSKSLDEGSVTGGGCQAAARYRALLDQDAVSMTGVSMSGVSMSGVSMSGVSMSGHGSLGSTPGSVSGSTGAIVRVEAHPESGRPVIQPPSTDGSWKWRSLDHGTGESLRQSFELNDLNRDSEGSEPPRDGSMDRRRSAGSQVEHRPNPHCLSTIRVTPGDGGGGGGGGGESTSDIPSVCSSRDSTLRRKANNIILIPERANSPDNARNVFYKGTSMTPTFKE
ncbi:phospholipid phosphatase-related protein type 4-like isoform X2 [Gadus chalcogrammus]|uniref:phospholipid phosphatase-related protein type 4-like isoform X2 n=1 Tax=Gadus chalcogrammus TaxID=1042646 RepID=UPI0024C4E2D0|nr:phospholipid phosphatase-related protein type 4-like isoform X2 [Gadus chalcogrammus]